MQKPISPSRVAITGMLCLATVMGIGRFAFTPILPMMLSEGIVDLPGASWLASANYLGYLLGALLCTVQPWIWRRFHLAAPLDGPWLIRAGLVATGVLTLGMALPLPALWPLLRFAAGVASALVFIYTSGWCMTHLARLGAAHMGGMIFMGPGCGIVVSGLAASVMVAWHQPSQLAWLLFSALAATLTAMAWATLRAHGTPVGPSAGVAHEEPAPAMRAGRTEVGLHAVAYGLAGLGYIITATFLPVIARQSLPESAWLDMFWPIFGTGVILGAALSTRIPTSSDMRLMLALCYLIQTAGIVLGIVSPTLAGFAIGSLLTGMPLTSITYLAMHECRRLRPAQSSALMGFVTAMYGVGQIAGPPLAAAILSRSTTPALGFMLSLQLAAGTLLLGMLIYLYMAWRYRMR